MVYNAKSYLTFKMNGPVPGGSRFMYKNIIFDLGGVVVDFNPRDFLMDYFMN